MLYGSHECARILLEEGLTEAIERHRVNGRALADGLAGMGLELYGDQINRMNNVVGVYIPEGVNGERIRHEMLLEFGIEIGTSFGPLKGVIWRIGTCFYSRSTFRNSNLRWHMEFGAHIQNSSAFKFPHGRSCHRSSHPVQQ